MLSYPHIDPIALSLGPIKIHWYGLMYLLAFLSAWLLAKRRIHQSSTWTLEQLSDLFFYVALGVLLGGRIGYMLFYDFSNFLIKPWAVLQIWQGGMSFHGGLLGVVFALYLYGRKTQKKLLELTDFCAPLVPIGLATGRIGNFINGELWGRITHVPWAMIFPHADLHPRHPSQLYECFFEGIILFIILWIYSKKPKPTGAVSGLFSLLYGIVRFGLEFFRQPDPQLGFIAWGWLTMGQLLCLPLIIFGMILLHAAYKK